MKKLTSLITLAFISLTSLNVNALEQVEQINTLHTDKVSVKLAIENTLKVSIKEIQLSSIDIAANFEQKGNVKLAKAKVKTNASSISE